MKKIIVTGNVGRDPEVRVDTAGNQFVTFSLGVNVGTKQNPKTDWVEVSCNNKLGDMARNYVKKGTKLLVEGFPSVNAYLNKENKAVASLRIYANLMEFLSKKEDSDNEALDNQYNDNSLIDLKDDEIPF